jgi:hypothetical protein
VEKELFPAFVGEMEDSLSVLLLSTRESFVLELL